MAGRHHRLDGRELERTPAVGDAQGGLECFGPTGSQSDRTEHLNRLRENKLACSHRPLVSAPPHCRPGVSARANPKPPAPSRHSAGWQQSLGLGSQLRLL